MAGLRVRPNHGRTSSPAEPRPDFESNRTAVELEVRSGQWPDSKSGRTVAGLEVWQDRARTRSPARLRPDSKSGQTVVGPQSDFDQTAVRIRPDRSRSAIRFRSDCGQNSADAGSGELARTTRNALCIFNYCASHTGCTRVSTQDINLVPF